MSYIEFPKLWGLKFNIDPIALQFGSITIYWYGIIIAAGFMLAVTLGMRSSRKFGLDPENVIDLVLYGAPTAIIFARLYYVIFDWKVYRDDPMEIFRIWNGGLAIYGGLIGALLVGYLFAKYKKIPVFKLLDFGMPYFVIAQAVGRWGNMVNQEAFGTNTSLPWGMTGDQIKYQLSILQVNGVNINPDLPVHPTFLYESLWNVAVFSFLIWYRKRRKFDGEVFFLYLMLYGAGRFWIEGLRTDSLMIGQFRASQVLSLILVIISVLAIFIKRRKLATAKDINEETDVSEYSNILKALNNETEDVIANSGTDEAALEGESAVPSEVSLDNDNEAGLRALENNAQNIEVEVRTAEKSEQQDDESVKEEKGT